MSEFTEESIIHLLEIMNERMKLCEKCVERIKEVGNLLNERLTVVEKFIFNGDE